jgi:hypothetical protein
MSTKTASKYEIFGIDEPFLEDYFKKINEKLNSLNNFELDLSGLGIETVRQIKSKNSNFFSLLNSALKDIHKYNSLSEKKIKTYSNLDINWGKKLYQGFINDVFESEIGDLTKLFPKINFQNFINYEFLDYSVGISPLHIGKATLGNLKKQFWIKKTSKSESVGLKVLDEIGVSVPKSYYDELNKLLFSTHFKGNTLLDVPKDKRKASLEKVVDDLVVMGTKGYDTYSTKYKSCPNFDISENVLDNALLRINQSLIEYLDKSGSSERDTLNKTFDTHKATANEKDYAYLIAWLHSDSKNKFSLDVTPIKNNDALNCFPFLEEVDRDKMIRNIKEKDSFLFQLYNLIESNVKPVLERFYNKEIDGKNIYRAIAHKDFHAKNVLVNDELETCIIDTQFLDVGLKMDDLSRLLNYDRWDVDEETKKDITEKYIIDSYNATFDYNAQTLDEVSNHSLEMSDNNVDYVKDMNELKNVYDFLYSLNSVRIRDIKKEFELISEAKERTKSNYEQIRDNFISSYPFLKYLDNFE